MPIIRYFLFTGGLLLALLFAADRYLPPPADHIGHTEVDKSTIRILSARPVPEKIEFDTSSPAAVAPSTTLADEQPENRPREAYAMMTEPSVGQKAQAAPAAARRAPARQHAARPRRMTRTPPERRLAFNRHELFSGW